MLVFTGLLVSGMIAGCSSDEASESRCHLMHEVVESPAEYGEVIETYRYENLSNEAQHVFEEAVATGSYATTDQNLEPAEFRYWDTLAVYDVIYRNETYGLLTYTGGGCERE